MWFSKPRIMFAEYPVSRVSLGTAAVTLMGRTWSRLALPAAAVSVTWYDVTERWVGLVAGHDWCPLSGMSKLSCLVFTALHNSTLFDSGRLCSVSSAFHGL